MMGDILYGILFNVMTLSMAAVPVIGLIFVYKWTMFSMYERPYHLYPEDAEHYRNNVSDDDKPYVSVKAWKQDRFAYYVHMMARYADVPGLKVKQTNLPFREWVETIPTEKREMWRHFGNPSISPGYPGAELEVMSKVYEISSRMKIWS